jgi:hypothetical protein
LAEIDLPKYDDTETTLSKVPARIAKVQTSEAKSNRDRRARRRDEQLEKAASASQGFLSSK